MSIFLIDFLADWYVEGRYGVSSASGLGQRAIVEGAVAAGAENADKDAASASEYLHSESDPSVTERGFQEQIAAFLILEFGVIFHSVIIGLNLGVVGDEFVTLYPVIVFHQAFEGLGIGARLSAIPFPKRLGWMPWALCAAYGLTTPISIAIGLGLSTSYDSGSYTANVVSGIFDSISAGILIYTGLVELLARDFLFQSQPHQRPVPHYLHARQLLPRRGYHGAFGQVGIRRQHNGREASKLGRKTGVQPV